MLACVLLFLSKCGFLLSLTGDYARKKEPNFNFPINVAGKGNQRKPNTNKDLK